MLSFSQVAEALMGLIYHRPSGENFSSARHFSTLPDDGRSISRNVAEKHYDSRHDKLRNNMETKLLIYIHLMPIGGTFISGGQEGLAAKFASEIRVRAPNFASKNIGDKYPKFCPLNFRYNP